MRHILDPENFKTSYPSTPCPHFKKNKLFSFFLDELNIVFPPQYKSRHVSDSIVMSSLDPTFPELQTVQNRLSETMREVQEKEKELQEMIDLVDSLTSVDQDLVTRSASSSRKKRGNPDVIKMDEYRKRINEQVAQKRLETSLLWQKINDLQAEEQKLKEQKGNPWA
jgi:uncharacterized protein YdhG (YjbR/CyaY superfamily)